jgi:hypothetical protein
MLLFIWWYCTFGCTVFSDIIEHVSQHCLLVKRIKIQEKIKMNNDVWQTKYFNLASDTISKTGFIITCDNTHETMHLSKQSQRQVSAAENFDTSQMPAIRWQCDKEDFEDDVDTHIYGTK